MLTSTDRQGLAHTGAVIGTRRDRSMAAAAGSAMQSAETKGVSSTAIDVWGSNERRKPVRHGASRRLDTLTDINLNDLMDAAGLSRLRHTPLQWLFRPSAQRFALVAHEFDDLVAKQGLAQGSSWLLHRMSAGAQVTGVEHVPAAGPVVILANHPGMTDTVALITSLASRPDLRVIAQDRPFLRALPHVADQLIFVPDDEVGRMSVLRAGARHLKQGGALLTFPAGDIEPDPETFGPRKAVESVQRWSDSLVVFARLAPLTRFVPAIVSNVISPGARRNVLTLLRRTAHERERLAAALQVALPRYRQMVAQVVFGPAQHARAADVDSLRSAIVAQVCHLIEASAGHGALYAASDGTCRGARRQYGEHPVVARHVNR